MKNILYVTALSLSVSIFSCQNTTTNVGQINTTISVDEFEKKLSEDKSVQLIDVRTPEEFSQGHLKGALNYNIRSDDFEKQIATLDKNKPVLVYCLSGGRSSTAAGNLGEKGFKEIYNMKGGIMKWNAANKPIDNGTASPSSGGMGLEEFTKLTNSKELVLVDYNAKWCVPCKKMAPMLDSFSEKRKDKLVLVKIDADENKDLLKEKKIEAIPVLELYKNGKLVWKHDGEIDEATLIKETKL